jgi:signal transduction histidine kinase
VSTVAHELRTPLTGLSGYLDLILDGQVDDDAVVREFLERGRSIVGSMTDLIGDLLELSRIESGSLVLESEPFSVAEAAAYRRHGADADRARPWHPARDDRRHPAWLPRSATVGGSGRS